MGRHIWEVTKPALAREMEVYAGFLEHDDYDIGRLVDALADLEILDDTMIYPIIGDNGASAEGTPNGTFNEMSTFNEQPEKLRELQQLFLDEARKYQVLPLDDRRMSGSTPISPAAPS